MEDVVLVCGVPGSGKSWACHQVKDKFNYVAHDQHLGKPDKAFVDSIVKAARGDKPVLADCPFGERKLMEALQAAGVNVKPMFVIEDSKTLTKRYFVREGRLPSKASLSRSESNVERAKGYGAFSGTSQAVYEALRDL